GGCRIACRRRCRSCGRDGNSLNDSSFPECRSAGGKSKGKGQHGEVASHHGDVDWGVFYDIAVCSWGMAPSEFWKLSPQEWWRIYEIKRPREPSRDLAGSLTTEDVERMKKLMQRKRSV